MAARRVRVRRGRAGTGGSANALSTRCRRAGDGPGMPVSRSRPSSAGRSGRSCWLLSNRGRVGSAECLADLPARPVQARPNGSHGNAERLGDFGVTQLAPGGQQQHVAVGGRQAAQCANKDLSCCLGAHIGRDLIGVPGRRPVGAGASPAPGAWLARSAAAWLSPWSRCRTARAGHQAGPGHSAPVRRTPPGRRPRRRRRHPQPRRDARHSGATPRSTCRRSRRTAQDRAGRADDSRIRLTSAEPSATMLACFSFTPMYRHLPQLKFTRRQ